jgi:hypothetical protein
MRSSSSSSWLRMPACDASMHVLQQNQNSYRNIVNSFTELVDLAGNQT